MKRLYMQVLLAVGVIALGISSSQAAEHSAVDRLWQEAQQATLSASPMWHKLVYYQPQGFGRGFSSDINSAAFFLSPQGEHDPAAELYALIEGVLAPVNALKPELHAQCRFPARFTWLQQQLDFSAVQLPTPPCEDYAAWRVNEQIDSVSLIWANGYLGNPSSFYGHVLLKLNYASTDPNSILGTTVNFGVDLPNNETPAVFVWRGLVGKYNAVFAYSRFHQNSLLYGEMQQRDLWEYRLNLPQDKVDFIVAHTWELLGQEFVYYFASENCAFRTAQVLDLVLEEPLGNQIKPWMLPHDIFNNLMAQTLDGEPVVRDVRYIPAGQSRFTVLYEALPKEQQRAVARHIAAPLHAKPMVNQPTATAQIDVLDTLLEYYGFYYALHGTQNDVSQARRPLLLQRLALAPSPPREFLLDQQPPHAGQFPSLLQASVFSNDALGMGVVGRFRLSYFDHLAPSQGRLPFMHMAMVDLSVAATENDIWLRRLDVIHIEALNLSRTGQPGDGGNAWKIRFGAEAADLSCTDCLQVFAEGGLGKGFLLGQDSAVYSMFEGRLDSGDKGHISGTARIGTIVGLQPWWKLHLDAGYRYHLEQDVDAEPMLAGRLRLGTGRRWDVVLSAEEHRARELKVAFSAHW